MSWITILHYFAEYFTIVIMSVFALVTMIDIQSEGKFTRNCKKRIKSFKNSIRYQFLKREKNSLTYTCNQMIHVLSNEILNTKQEYIDNMDAKPITLVEIKTKNTIEKRFTMELSYVKVLEFIDDDLFVLKFNRESDLIRFKLSV